MYYTILSLKEMKTALLEISELYQRSERKAEVERLKAFINFPHVDAEIMFGMFLATIQTIRFNEYHGRSPLKTRWGTGSSLCTLIAEKLKLKNVLKDDENLIYIAKYNEYLSNLPAKYWNILNQSKMSKLIQLEDLLKQLRKEENRRIKVLSHGVPKLAFLEKRINTFLPTYQPKSWLFFGNQERTQLVDLVNLIEKSLVMYREKNHNQTLGNEYASYESDFYVHHTLLGVILFGLISIANEYPRKKLWSPKHCDLFRRLLNILMIEDLNDIPFEKKELWLEAFFNHLNQIKNNPVQYETLLKAWEKSGVKLDEVRSKLHEYIHLEKKNNQSSVAAYYISQGTSLAVQYGTGFTITQLGKSYALSCVGGMVGPFAVALYSTAGTLLMSQIGRLVSENLMPSAVSYVYTKILETIGETIASGTTKAFNYTFSIGKKGLNQLIGQAKPEDQIFLMEYINTLLRLSDKIVSKDEKEQIKDALGIENELTYQSLVAINNDQENSQMKFKIVS